MDGIVTLTLPTPYPVGPINLYLIEGEPLTLVDAGPRTEEARVALHQELAHQGYSLADIRQVVITHPHVDHVGLLAEVVAESGAKVVTHPRNQDWLTDFAGEWRRLMGFFASVYWQEGVPMSVLQGFAAGGGGPPGPAIADSVAAENIALVNELALLCERMGIDLWEVIEAAKTKPFGFMPFYPGPGVGGHCIPVDPYYLSWKAREYDFYTKFIELAAEVNQAMPYHVVNVIADGLSRQGKSLRGARVLILGVAFKRDIEDARNSPAERIIELLLERGAEVAYNDPYVPRFRVGNDVFLRHNVTLESVPLDDATLAEHDCVTIVTGHSGYDYSWIVAQAPLVVDTVNATRQVQHGRGKVVRIGNRSA